MWLVYFIMESPYVNGRMVETLPDQFAQLRLCVFCFIAGYTINERYFGPDNQSKTITTGIKIIGLLVVGKTNSCSSYIHDSSQVKIVLLIFKSTSQAPPVLMSCHSIHRIFLSVQIETFAGYDLVFAYSQWLGHFINHFTIGQQTGNNFV